jgi:putative endonuclease
MVSREIHKKRTIKREDNFFVYIVQCRNGTYYTGYTNNLQNRIALHNSGNGAKYLRGKLPVKLVYSKEYHYYKNVLRAERSLKKLTRAQKTNLIKIYAENNLKKTE